MALRRLLAVFLILAPAYGQKAQFVTVNRDVRLEVLDWGGSGRDVVLLAGGGNTAHVFDDFAPKLTATCHVYGITRAGFGSSGFTAAEYGSERLGDDVLEVLAALKLSRPVLVGHSIGGAELSSVGSRHPERVAGLIYLDAGYPYAFHGAGSPTMDEFQAVQGPQPPSPGAENLASFAALGKWFAKIDGFSFPESELRQTWDSTPDGKVTRRHDSPGSRTLLKGMKDYTKIPVPALAIFAVPHDLGAWVRNSSPSVREAASAYSAALTALTERQVQAFEKGVPTARVVRLAGAHHYVFLSNEGDVLREMRAFLAGLR